jgi:hypothetical protein
VFFATKNFSSVNESARPMTGNMLDRAESLRMTRISAEDMVSGAVDSSPNDWHEVWWVVGDGRLRAGFGGQERLGSACGALSVDVLENAVHLALELELSLVGKIKTGGVDDGKQDPVETRLADLDAGGLDRLRALRGTVQEAVEGCLLVDGRGRRNVLRFEQQPKQGGFAC